MRKKCETNQNNSNLAYNDTSISLYDDCFSWVKIKMKARNPFRPWITKGIAKSSRKKQKSYEKYLENRNPQN